MNYYYDFNNKIIQLLNSSTIVLLYFNDKTNAKNFTIEN